MQQPPVRVQNTKTRDLREEKRAENIWDLKRPHLGYSV